MTAKLATVDQLLARLGLDEDDLSDEYLARMNLALESATLHLEAILRTKFARQVDVTERYQVDPDQFPFLGEFPYLYLKNGHVDDQATFTLTQASFYDDLVAGNAQSTELTIIEDYVVDYEKGIVQITGEGLLNVPGYRKLFRPDAPYYAQVVYTSGFNTTADTYGTTFTGAPDWLSEAAMLVGNHLYKRTGDCNQATSEMTKELGGLMNLIESHVRYHPYAVKAML